MADEPVSVTQGATKVASGIVTTLGANPLSLALLLVNIAFLGFAAYILGEVASNARERNKIQNELIASLVHDIRDCRQPMRLPRGQTPSDGMRDDRDEKNDGSEKG